MLLVIGSTTLSDGTRTQPWELLSIDGQRVTETATRIRASDVAVLDRKNRSFSDTVRLTRSWSSADATILEATLLQKSLLALAPSALRYGNTYRGSGVVCTHVNVEVFGVTAVFTITFEGVIDGTAYTSS